MLGAQVASCWMAQETWATGSLPHWSSSFRAARALWWVLGFLLGFGAQSHWVQRTAFSSATQAACNLAVSQGFIGMLQRHLAVGCLPKPLEAFQEISFFEVTDGLSAMFFIISVFFYQVPVVGRLLESGFGAKSQDWTTGSIKVTNRRISSGRLQCAVRPATTPALSMQRLSDSTLGITSFT